MNHMIFQLGLFFFIVGIITSFTSYYLLQKATVGGYPTVLIVASVGSFFGGTLGNMIFSYPGLLNISWGGSIGSISLAAGILLLYHKACRLYKD